MDVPTGKASAVGGETRGWESPYRALWWIFFCQYAQLLPLEGMVSSRSWRLLMAPEDCLWWHSGSCGSCWPSCWPAPPAPPTGHSVQGAFSRSVSRWALAHCSHSASFSSHGLLSSPYPKPFSSWVLLYFSHRSPGSIWNNLIHVPCSEAVLSVSSLSPDMQSRAWRLLDIYK